jgi:hypothetical protein
MLISLHKQATTTPKIRAAIQASAEPGWLVAERYGISEQTVWKWRGRVGVQPVTVTRQGAQCVPQDIWCQGERRHQVLQIMQRGTSALQFAKRTRCFGEQHGFKPKQMAGAV